MKVKRVRIAVVVLQDGSDWSSAGWCSERAGDQQFADTALETLTDGPYVLRFVEADIELPESTTIEGVVVP